MSEVISTKRIRNKEANRKHQTTYMSDPEKKELHKARMQEYYQNNKEKIKQRSRETLTGGTQESGGTSIK